MSSLVSLLPATVFVVIGYIVIYSSAKSEGGVQPFGQILGAWLLVLGGVAVLGGTPGPMFGLQGPTGGMSEQMSRMETLEEEQLAILRELLGG